MREYKYFSPEEFERCVPSCSIEQMDSSFMEWLDRARELAGIPFVLNSAYRSSEYDKAKGRTGVGYHTFGRAVDVRCLDGISRAAIVCALLDCGFSVGIHNRFVHVDNRPVQTCFLYK